MSDQPPPMQPPAGSPPPLTPPRTKPSFNEWFRTSPWWHKALVLLPILLVLVGGLLGALTGILMATANQAVLRSRLTTAAKVAVCVGIIVVGTVVLLVVVAAVQLMLGVATSSGQ